MAKFVVEDAVRDAWNRLTTDNSSTSWIACGYPEGSSNSLVFKGEGPGGLPEFIAKLPADDIVWGAVKVVAVDDRGNLVSRRPKFVSVKWCPSEGIAPMKRAKSGGHKGAVKQVMSSHVDIEIDSLDGLTEDVIIQKLRACGGAHQPTSYEFSNYTGMSSRGSSSPVPAARQASSAAAPEPAPAVSAPAPEPVKEEEEVVAAEEPVKEEETVPTVEEEEAAPAAAQAVDEEVAALEQETEALDVAEE